MLRFAAVSSWIVLLAACDGPGPTGEVDAGQPDAAADAASAGDAGAGDGAVAPRRVGWVRLLHLEADGPAVTVAYADFFEDPTSVTGDARQLLPCPAVMWQGACALVTCADFRSNLSAGTVTVRADGTEVAELMLTLEGYARIRPGRSFEPGDMISFDASGDVVPAFAGAAEAPDRISVTLPATAPRNTALALDFSATSERVKVELSNTAGAIHCFVDGSEGTVTIAPELLSELPAGDATLTLSAYNATEVSAGDYDVLLSAEEAIGTSLTLE